MLILLWFMLGCGREPDPPPNIVLVVVDTLRKDRLSVYGNPRKTTPNLETLAADGVRYDRANSQAPWTLPSTAAIHTGRLPSELAVNSGKFAIPREAQTLAQVLGERGYATAGVVSHSYVGRRYGFNRGFDTWNEDMVRGPGAIVGGGVTNRVVQWLDSREDDKPFFLFIHYFDPHYTYMRHDRWDWSQDEAYRGWVKPGMSIKRLKKQADKRWKPADRTELLRIYDSEIAYTDHQVGRVFDELRERGLYDNTLVVFTHDHGEAFMEHGTIGHSAKLWEQVISSPLIVKYPRQKRAGTVDSQPRMLVDIFPTVVGEAHDRIGRPLHANVPADRLRYSETTREGDRRVVLRGHWKYVHDRKRGMLFDLEADPLEENNLIEDPSHASVLEQLTDAAMNWPGERLQGDEPVELTDAETQALEALGYLDP